VQIKRDSLARLSVPATRAHLLQHTGAPRGLTTPRDHIDIAITATLRLTPSAAKPRCSLSDR
jgi:hypothetical protein